MAPFFDSERTVTLRPVGRIDGSLREIRDEYNPTTVWSPGSTSDKYNHFGCKQQGRCDRVLDYHVGQPRASEIVHPKMQATVEQSEMDGASGTGAKPVAGPIDNLSSRLEEETRKESKFNTHPIQVEMMLHLVLITNVPGNVKRGAACRDVFADGIEPGILLGTKESRARQSLLLGYATDDDQRKAIKYLEQVRKSKPTGVLRTISGVLDFSKCQVKAFGKQMVSCPPVPEIFASPYFEESTECFKDPCPLTLHAWAVVVDVFDPDVAQSPRELAKHFEPFTKSAAIINFSPASVGSSSDRSTKATVYVLDKASVEYLKRQATALMRFSYFKVLSVREEDRVFSALCGVRDVALMSYLTMDAESSPLTSPMTVKSFLTRRTHMRLIFQLWAQDKWTIGCDMDNVTFEALPAFPQFYPFKSYEKVVSLPGRNVGQILLTAHREEAETLLSVNNCEVKEQRNGALITSFAYRAAVINAKSSKDVAKGKAALEKLASDILRQRVYKRMTLDQPELYCALRLYKLKLVQGNESVHIIKPRIRPLEAIPRLCTARIVMNPERRRSMRLEVTKPVNGNQFLMVDVDAMVLFSNSRLHLIHGLAANAVNHGGTGVVDDCDAYFSLNGPLDREAPALSSGKLTAPVVIHANPYVKKHETCQGMLKRVLAAIVKTACDVGATSIAIPYASIPPKVGPPLTGRQWFSVVCEALAQSPQPDSRLERVVIAYDPKRTHEPVADLTHALRRLAKDAPTAGVVAAAAAAASSRAAIEEFTIAVEEDVAAAHESCPPSASILLVAETHDHLEAGEKAIRETFLAELDIEHHLCPGVDCGQVVQNWNDRLMHLKAKCSLRPGPTQEGKATVSLHGYRQQMDETGRPQLKKLIEELKSGTLGPCPPAVKEPVQDVAGSAAAAAAAAAVAAATAH